MLRQELTIVRVTLNPREAHQFDQLRRPDVLAQLREWGMNPSTFRVTRYDKRGAVIEGDLIPPTPTPHP